MGLKVKCKNCGEEPEDKVYKYNRDWWCKDCIVREIKYLLDLIT